MHCRFADSAWRESLWAISLSRIPLVSPAELIDTILNADMVLGLDKKYLRAFALNAAIVFDVLWHTRNLVVHEDARADIGTIVESIRRRFAEHSGAWNEVDRAVSSSWQPPLSGWLKVNMDVAIRSSESYIAISVRDSHSSLCLAYTERLVFSGSCLYGCFSGLVPRGIRVRLVGSLQGYYLPRSASVLGDSAFG